MSAIPNELNLPEGTTIEKALGSLTVEEAQVLYWKFQEISYPAIGLEFRKSEGWVEAMMRRVYEKLGLGDKSIHSLEKTRRLKKYYRTPFQSMIWGDFKKIAEVFGAKEPKVEPEVAKEVAQATEEQVKAMPAGTAEELPRVDQKPVTDGEVPNVPGFPRRLLIAIPVLLACVVCALIGWRIVLPMIGNDPIVTETLAIPVPQDTETPLTTTNTPPLVVSETSLPTSTTTNTALPPTLTSTPTNTPLPTESPTSSVPALFFDDFNNGKSDQWQLIYGSDPVIVNGSLTFNENTQMIIDQEWTDYELSFYVSNMQCQEHVSSSGLTVGLRVQGANNMIALRMKDQDYCEGTWGQIQNSEFDSLPTSNFKLPPVDSNQGRQITIRVQGNTFSTPIGTSVVIENYATGGIAFIGAQGVTVDNVRVTQLTP